MNNIFAKSKDEHGIQETLEEHIEKVIDKIIELKFRTGFAEEILQYNNIWDILFWSAVFHDLGKSALSFQKVLKGLKQKWEHRHEILSIIYLPFLFQEDKPEYKYIVSIILSHHKDINTLFEKYNYNNREYLELKDIINEISDFDNKQIIEFLRNKVNNVIGDKNLSQYGIKTYNFIESYSRDNYEDTIIQGLKTFEGYYNELKKMSAKHIENIRAILFRGLFRQADHIASAGGSKLNSVRFKSPLELAKNLNINPDAFYYHQKQAGIQKGSYILTAPTGSGKTETSLLWAYAQQDNDERYNKLFFILPYQASINAATERLRQLLKCEVGMLHAKSVQVLFKELLNDTQGEDYKEIERQARYQKDLNKKFHPPVLVSSPYQILKAGFQIKGYENIMAMLTGGLFVVDEIHAYEPVRLGMFLSFLKELKDNWKAEILCMTATMPTWLRTLIKDMFIRDEITADEKLYKDFVRHRLELLDTNIQSDQVINKLIELYKEQKSILVAVNTVKQAQRLYTALKKNRNMNSQIILLHSRFNVRDRLNKERIINNVLNTRKGTKTPIIVIATQVIEVSLDLDFDTIISEPAPIEALIQRFGRVNRSRKKGIVPVYVVTESEGAYKVYDKDFKADSIIKNSIEVLKKYQGKEIDEMMVSKMIDESYSNGLAEELSRKTQNSMKYFTQHYLEKLYAFEPSNEIKENEFDSLFNGIEILPKCLLNEYEQLRQKSIILANELLVPVSYNSIDWKKKVGVTENKIPVFDFDYDKETGLIYRKFTDG